MRWSVAEQLFPSTIDRISMQIALIGAALLKKLGSDIRPEVLLCYPNVGRRGPSGEELERRLMMYFGAVKTRLDKAKGLNGSSGNGET